MKLGEQARQGDVLIVRKNVTKTDKPVPQDNGKTVLAYGEVTGHSHALPMGDLFVVNELTKNLLLKEGSELRHEEHGSIPLTKGSYEIVQQRQWTLERIRRVAD
jgi:hypothetical protein